MGDEYKSLFVSEARENLQTMNNSLLELEENPEDEESLNEMFRAAHSLKGTAGAMGYEDIQELSHTVENLMDGFREHELAIDEETVDVLFEGLDTLEEMVEGVVSDEETERDLSDIYEKLEKVAPEGEELEEVEESKEVSVEEDQKEGESGEQLEEDFEADSGGGEEDLEEEEETPEGNQEKGEEKSSESKTKKTSKSKSSASTIRIDVEKVESLQDLAGELLISQMRASQISSEHDIEELNEVMTDIDRLTSELQYTVLSTRMSSVNYLFGKFPRLVRDLSKQQGKEIDLNIEGEETELDRLVMDEINDALVHLIRNSIDHGIETPEEREEKGKDPTGKIDLIARRQGDYVIIEVKDDGQGIDPEKVKEKAIQKGVISEEEAEGLEDKEVYELLGKPGFSTKEEATEISGRGVGFDVVERKVESLGGSVKIESEKDKGTNISLRIPLTTAIIQSLMVGIGEEKYAVPLRSVEEVAKIDQSDLSTLNKKEVINYRGRVVPILDLREKFGVEDDGIGPLVIVNKRDELVGLMVDHIDGQQETVIKPLEGILKGLRNFGGATILPDGSVALVLNIAGLLSF